ncbi:MAG: hypothetical protein Q8K72_05170, partial [Acidimicrobiales bacterium]|nr:hypothetical protein [Acidimicrobiales bacterium]
ESAVSLAIEAGVSRGTIYRWAREAGARLDTSRTAAATAGASARWASRRAGLADEIGEAAQKALELCSSNLDDGAVRNAKDAALAMAILVDKAELLAGNATSRNGTVADPFTLIEAGRARVHQLRPPRDSA